MAYNRRYNPDALPAFAEPESSSRPPKASSSTSSTSKPSSSANPPPPRTDSYATKPQPLPPLQNLRVSDDVRRPAPGASGYQSPATGGRQGGGGGGGSYDDRDRRGGGYDDRDRRGGGPPPPQIQSPGGYGSPLGSRNNSYEGTKYRQQGEEGRYGGAQAAPGPARAPSYTGSNSGTGAAVRAQRDGNDRDGMWNMFKTVDRDHSGQLSEDELGKALVNGDYTSFDPHTVKMMIRMFDVDRSGTISFEEFCGLWGFLSEWRKLFDRFDVDQSGTISFDEFTDALVAFGYRLSREYVTLLFNTYDTKQRGVLSFDLFVQACISLKRMTDVFKKYDTDRDGYITLSFEEFLTGSQSLFLINSISPATDTKLY